MELKLQKRNREKQIEEKKVGGWVSSWCLSSKF